MFRLGELLRKLYNGFLSDIYSKEKFQIEATMVERTMLSAATFAAGLWPPRRHQMWHDTIYWQPIPIYPNFLDKSLVSNKKYRYILHEHCHESLATTQWLKLKLPIHLITYVLTINKLIFSLKIFVVIYKFCCINLRKKSFEELYFSTESFNYYFTISQCIIKITTMHLQVGGRVVHVWVGKCDTI